MEYLVREQVTEPVSSVPVAFPRPSLGVVAFGVVTFEMVALEKPWLEKAAFESMVRSSDMLSESETSSAMMLLHSETISEPTAEERCGAASDTEWSATPCLFLPPSQRKEEENWRWEQKQHSVLRPSLEWAWMQAAGPQPVVGFARRASSAREVDPRFAVMTCWRVVFHRVCLFFHLGST